ncbi:MAG TPA: G1 family glutamic endopeptidase [Streptosporangiaceae bacterium]|nr:G1 family glutamic endopeptidase [Streptosporangiaceae bacterium]
MRTLERGCAAAVAALSVVLTAGAFTAPRAAARPAPATPRGPMLAAPRPWAGAARRAAGLLPPGQRSRGAVPPGQPGLPGAARDAIDSYNWAGYAAARTGTAFRSVRAAFFVPYVDCHATPGASSSDWVGLDGLGSASVEQIGVAAGCAGSRPQYYAWYEMYPKTVRRVFPVHPGNAITASVRFQPGRRKFVLNVRDISSGRQLRRALRCAAQTCGRSSAEVISEAPSSAAGKILPLADYRAAGFSAVAVGTARHRSGLRSRWWRTYRVVGVGRISHQVIQQPSALYQGRAFGTYWFRAR